MSLKTANHQQVLALIDAIMGRPDLPSTQQLLGKAPHAFIPATSMYGVFGIGSAALAISSHVLPQTFALSLPSDLAWVQLALTGMLSLAALVCISTHLQIRSRVRRIGRRLAELQQVRTFLDNFLTELDERTRTYFHSITASKLAAHFTLTQLRHALDRRISQIEQMTASGRDEGLAAAYLLSKEPLTFSHSVLETRDSRHYVPLDKLAAVAVFLADDIEREVRLLEQSIQDMRTRGTMNEEEAA